MIKKQVQDKIVLVSVVKSRRDLNLILTKNLYRIPIAHSPKIRFNYLAFYQPVIFGRQGKRIVYYTKIKNYQVVRRNKIFPEEINHPRANNYYFIFKLGKVKKLVQPIKNIIPRRISFGFTTLKNLRQAKNILQLYQILPTEQIIENALKRMGVKTKPQHNLSFSQKRFRLDLAIFCKKGMIAVECDNKKAHSSRQQRQKDKIKDKFLTKIGWTVIRLTEDKITKDLFGCLKRISSVVDQLGGTMDI